MSESEDTQTTEIVDTQPTTEEQQSEPATTAQEAYDRAVANLSVDDRREYRQRMLHAASAGLPTPTPPGYEPPAPPPEPTAEEREQADDERMAELLEQIEQARTDGDWETSRALVSQATDIRNARIRRESPASAPRYYGVMGPT